jgi:signal peptidase I
MNFFEWRRRRKTARHWRHELHHARAMHEDVAAPDDLARLDRAAEHLAAAAPAATPEAFEAACAEAGAAIAAVRPPRRFAAFAENVEVIVVAISIAMAIRCFLVQPFKIPTGSMQPTLYGITFADQAERGFWDRPPLSFIGWALFGEGYVEVRAKTSGFLAPQARQVEDSLILFVDGTPHTVRRNMPRRRQPGEYLRRGDVIASGRMRYGDHVLVNKVLYNFRRPRRGEVIVFETARILHPQIRQDTFYIKRLVGLPGERIELDPPWLVADGRRVAEPPAFRRQAEDEHLGYYGYIFADPRITPRPFLAAPGDRIDLPADTYLPLGDNTRSSLDGRYFGPVPWRSVVGPAFAVYWPFSRRWGSVQ